MDLGTCNIINTIGTGHIKVYDVDFSYDGTKMLTCGDDNKFKVWDISATNIRTGIPSVIGGGFNTGNKIWSCKFSFDDYVLVGCDTNLVTVYGPGFGNTVYSNNAHGGGKA